MHRPGDVCLRHLGEVNATNQASEYGSPGYFYQSIRNIYDLCRRLLNAASNYSIGNRTSANVFRHWQTAVIVLVLTRQSWLKASTE
jgi:hypothetical protein